MVIKGRKYHDQGDGFGGLATFLIRAKIVLKITWLVKTQWQEYIRVLGSCLCVGLSRPCSLNAGKLITGTPKSYYKIAKIQKDAT